MIAVYTLALLAALMLAAGASAQGGTSGDAPKPAPKKAGAKTELPIEQGFPFDCIAYGELNMRGGVAAWTDLDAFVKAGAVGMGYPDLVEQLSGPFKWGDERPINGNDLRLALRGTKRIGGAVIDMTTDGVSWLVVIEHDDPASVIDMMTAVASSKAVLFEKRGDHNGTPIYQLQAPEDWLPEMLTQFTNRRRFWGWGGAAVDRYTDPILVSEWGGKYLLIASREADILDAVENYENADEPEYTLAGSRPFADARKESLGQDFMLYWNLDSFIKKMERLVGMGGAQAQEYIDLIEAVMELKQFRALTVTSSYDAPGGWARAAAKLTFHNRPTWLSVFPFDPKPAPLTDFCPQKPALYMGAAVDSPARIYKEMLALVKQKCEAVGRPKEWESIAKSMETFVKENGFAIDDAVAQLGSEHAIFWMSPYVPPGETRRGDGCAVVMRVKDVAAATDFMQQKVLTSPGMREAFHVNQRKYLEMPAGGPAAGERIGYWVFNADDESSFAYLFLDGCLIMGTQDAVRAAITARKSGTNLGSDERFKELDARLPKGGLMSVYSDLGFLAENAEKIFPQSPAEENQWNEWGGGGMRIMNGWDDGSTAETPKTPDEPDELTLPAKLMKNHMPQLRVGARLVLAGNSIEVAIVAIGLPNTAGIADMWATIARHVNWRESRDALRQRLGPAIVAHLFEHGDLPADSADFAKKGGDPAVFRDPNLAGPAAAKPAAQQSFVWLGNHAGRDLTPAVPLAHTRDAGENGMYILLMSDASVHRVTKAQLDSALKAGDDPKAEPPFHSGHPQTLKELLPKLIDEHGGEGGGPSGMKNFRDE